MIKSTFKDSDCIFLLKDLTNEIKPITVEEKEELINQGINYSEVISVEEPISDEVNSIFKELVLKKADDIAKYVGIIADEIYRRGKEKTIVVSLARAGSPVGALIKRYILKKYNIDIPHYSISIIKGKGIDVNALNYIRNHHHEGIISFVDGWTGRGSITHELKNAISQYNNDYHTNISADLAVLADPAKLSAISGTKEDVCIPNACLNSTISGLVSRTIHNDKYIHENDFHGAIIYENLKYQDMTNYFLDTIEKHFSLKSNELDSTIQENYVLSVIEKLKIDFPTANMSKTKLSIGECSRALIRRKPVMLLIKNPANPNLSFVLHLAKEKKVPVRIYDTFDYECIAILN